MHLCVRASACAVHGCNPAAAPASGEPETEEWGKWKWRDDSGGAPSESQGSLMGLSGEENKQTLNQKGWEGPWPAEMEPSTECVRCMSVCVFVHTFVSACKAHSAYHEKFWSLGIVTYINEIWAYGTV